MTRQKLTSIAVTALLVGGMALPALAAGDDWAKPVEEGVKSLTTTIVTVAGALIGLSIVFYGLWSAMKQQIAWDKFWIFFVCGMLVTIGPGAIMWWIDKMKSAAG